MNRISELRQSAGMTLHELAEDIGADVVEVAMAERGIGYTHYDLVCDIAESLDCKPEDLYPDVAQNFKSLQGVDDMNELREKMLSPDHSQYLAMAGIDPDTHRWFATVKLKSGNERRYLLSSPEYNRIRRELRTMESAGGFLVFGSDCRHVIVRSSSILELKFSNKASYAYFSSSESANHVTLVSPRSPRPETIAVTPDGTGTGQRPFAALVQSAIDDAMNLPFVLMEEFGDEVYVSVDLMEVIEIPFGITKPDLYLGNNECSVSGIETGTLQEMVAMGQA